MEQVERERKSSQLRQHHPTALECAAEVGVQRRERMQMGHHGQADQVVGYESLAHSEASEARYPFKKVMRNDAIKLRQVDGGDQQRTADEDQPGR